MIEMFFQSISRNAPTQQVGITLKCLDQDRYLLVWIAERDVNAIHFSELATPRPLTHDLMKSLVEATGAQFARVVITDFNDNVYYAQIILEIAGEETAVDARPSDAIALALRTKSPIFATEQVLDQVGASLGDLPTSLKALPSIKG